ncbi:hypothetical protein MVLG_04629 [Microbotryum lychnidis-dioicae p1A1 Lamole]|uniref:Uncharacterized protein n=2 Tax=Microbotryum TaxID=34416 RepID=U5HBT5_USTV1|nr:hypothetical protein MVLG_04629 [Microbotryum lychnidis-dioicae p1A1 Lamole]|eukprot:KDE04981.1 hypothetical protein MVLG_04629 [Microbotryum lychnidis-dioicae p1A1 Lamole]
MPTLPSPSMTPSSLVTRTRSDSYRLWPRLLHHPVDSLVNRPNTIHARQAALQADPRPVYQKMPRARLYMGAFLTLFTIGTVGIARGTFNMMRGKKD